MLRRGLRVTTCFRTREMLECRINGCARVGRPRGLAPASAQRRLTEDQEYAVAECCQERERMQMRVPVCQVRQYMPTECWQRGFNHGEN